MVGVRGGRFLPILPAIAAVSGMLGGCGGPPRPPAAAHLTETGEDTPALKPVLSAEDEREIRSAFHDLAAPAAGDAPDARPRPAAHDVRWDDLDDALFWAANDVEMAVLHRIDEPWGARFALRTVEDRPAELRVRRLDPPAIYEAEATVGRFDDDAARARALLDALDRRWRAFGRKRGWE